MAYVGHSGHLSVTTVPTDKIDVILAVPPTRAILTDLTRNSYDLDSAGLITQRIVDRPGVTGVTVCKTCDCDEYENWGGQEPVQCGMCCNAAYLDQIPDDGQITDVIEARVPDEKETRGTREQLKNGIAKWSNLKFHTSSQTAILL